MVPVEKTVSKSRQPFISVIVPVYLVERYLPECIESIMNQTYQNLEIILIDDGSTDNCGKICDEYARRDKRIRVLHTINGGLSAARNFGIAKAKGEYLGFVDGDDWIDTNMYALLVSIAEENQADVVSCGFYNDYVKKIVIAPLIDKRFDNSFDASKALLYGDISNTVWNKIFRRSCFSSIRFPEGHVFEDIAIQYKILAMTTCAVSISKPLYHHRMKREGAITQTFSMDNLIDFWLAHKSRYDFYLCDNRFNTDKELTDKLLYWCAIAISRTWRWCYTNSDQERKNYSIYFKEMNDFSVQHFPVFGMKNWPLYLRVSIFFTRFNNKFVFTFLYGLNQIYRWCQYYFAVSA